jgi:hypothetical protein
MEAGMVPDNSLKCKNRFSRFNRFPSSLGTGPASMLEKKLRVSSSVSEPSAVGIPLVNSFCCIERTLSFELFPISVGIGPVKTLLFKVRNSSVKWEELG